MALWAAVPAAGAQTATQKAPAKTTDATSAGQTQAKTTDATESQKAPAKTTDATSAGQTQAKTTDATEAQKAPAKTGGTPALPPSPAKLETKNGMKADMKPVLPAAKPAPVTKSASVNNGWKLKFSGFMRLDSSYSTYQTFHITSSGWVMPKGSSNDHSTLDYTARNTRIRMTLMAPRVSHWNANGIVEVDFFGNLPTSGTSVRQPMPRMRLAYVELKRKFSKMDVNFQFGNAWMVAAPQFASSIDPFNLWAAGNLWMRYPQVKFDSKYSISKTFRLELAGSIGQNMGGDGPSSSIIFNGGIGEKTGTPVYQGRMGLGFKLGKASWSTIGVSASFQEWDLSKNESWVRSKAGLASDDDILASFYDINGEKMLNSWFMAVDANLKMKLGKYGLNLKGEFHRGQGIGIYWGAALNNIQFIRDNDGNLIDAKAVPGNGFFSDLTLSTPFRMKFTAGYGLSSADKDYVKDGGRVNNSVVYGVVTYKMKDAPVIFGASYEFRSTDYKDSSNGSTGDLDSNAHIARIMVTMPF